MANDGASDESVEAGAGIRKRDHPKDHVVAVERGREGHGGREKGYTRVMVAVG